MYKEITVNKCLSCGMKHDLGTIRCTACNSTQIGAQKEISEEFRDMPFEVVIFNKTTGAKEVVGFLLRKDVMKCVAKQDYKTIRNALASEISGALAQILQKNELLMRLCEEPEVEKR